MNQPSINYEQLGRQLTAADIDNSASEVHGVLCGLLCGGAEHAQKMWEDELFSDPGSEGDLLLQECKASLAGLFQSTQATIAEPELSFTALLPEDDKGIKERGAAVVDWCQGFLYGLGVSGASQEQLAGDAAEALQSLSEISHMDVDALEENEEDAAALEEVVEFIWVAALLLHSELSRESVA